MNTIWQIVIPVLSAAIAWISSKLTTRRERKKFDLQLINESINPLMNSIKGVMEYNQKLTEDLLTAQKEKLVAIEERAVLLEERTGLVEQIAKLNRRIASLERLIKKQVHEKVTSESATELPED